MKKEKIEKAWEQVQLYLVSVALTEETEEAFKILESFIRWFGEETLEFKEVNGVSEPMLDIDVE